MEENVNKIQVFQNTNNKQTVPIVNCERLQISDLSAAEKLHETFGSVIIPLECSIQGNQTVLTDPQNTIPGISADVSILSGNNILSSIVISDSRSLHDIEKSYISENIDPKQNTVSLGGDVHNPRVEPCEILMNDHCIQQDTNENKCTGVEFDSSHLTSTQSSHDDGQDNLSSVEKSIAMMDGSDTSTIESNSSLSVAQLSSDKIQMQERLETELQLLTESTESIESLESDTSPVFGHSLSESTGTNNNTNNKLIKESVQNSKKLEEIKFKVKNDVNGDENQDSYKYISRVSTEDIMKVYDKKNKYKKNQTHNKSEPIMLNKILNSAAYSVTSIQENTGQDNAVMNNLQLLAILEGGNEQNSILSQETNSADTHYLEDSVKEIQFKKRKSHLLNPELEKSLALKQLKELPLMKKKTTQKKRTIIDVKIPKVTRFGPRKNEEIINNEPSSENSDTTAVCDPLRSDSPVKTYAKNSVSDVSLIMQDWTDDEAKDKSDEIEISQKISKTQTGLSIEVDISLDKTDSSIKSPEVDAAPKRISRVIKKKIIYDPDNPATFKFASSVIKKETAPLDKPVDNSQAKTDGPAVTPKVKVVKTKVLKKNSSLESDQISINSDSPDTKNTSLKKKQANNMSSVKKKKMSEVDRLLMDEGAVNMIYQVERSNNNVHVPEIDLKPNKNSMISKSKEKKSIVSKAKIIKKAVFNLTNTKDPTKTVKVFRARKDTKAPEKNSEVEQKVSGLRSSMQSPSLSEVSVTRSGADESRIIRRHSSSSFSSGCLSPRPQSPSADMMTSLPASGTSHCLSTSSVDGSVIMNNDSGIQSSNPYAKNKYPVPVSIQGIKRKGRALEGSRTSMRQKRIQNATNKIESEKPSIPIISNIPSIYTQLSLEISDAVAHITVKPTGNSEELYDYLVLRELSNAIRACSEVGAVLLTSAGGAFCGGLDLRAVIQPTHELQRNNAKNIIDAFKELVLALCMCRGGVVAGVGGPCGGPGLGLLTLADLSLASDRATFCASPRSRRRLPVEGGSLLALSHALPQQLSREIVMCGRKLTASEAMQRGLVARTLWPDRFLDELRSITADIAQHPPESFDVIKSVLRRGEVAALEQALNYEGELLMEFWCSEVGQDAIRDTHAHL